jgi:hypothetical protein
MVFLAALIVVAAFSIGFGFGNSASADPTPSPSGTSIPVKKGGTGATDKTNALKNLLPDLSGNDGKVLGLNSGTPTWVDQTGGGATSYMFPDYANMETIKQISANNGTWQVDRDGYIFGYGYNETGNFDILVDGVAAAHFGSFGASSWGATVQVTKGSKVQIKSTGSNVTNIACYFIPPKYSTPPQPIVVDEGVGGSYSLDEVKTAETWLDGKPIYKKTLAWTTTTVAIGASENIAAVNDIETIVDTTVKNVSGTSAITVLLSGNTVVLRNEMTAQISAGVQWYITIYYTKTTD